ncbi:hypothetical protein QJS10_CPA09g00921 [Acorus calamus]|uniref:Pentatricopeptide repeat-containing protein n=1 Tax=Acorus calamus TaxID=4465 RepID=A0AAV9E5L6_ACOCL|nr:hypothetical protein QJS10_CPA09g00921 [Acorus calamus]
MGPIHIIWEEYTSKDGETNARHEESQKDHARVLNEVKIKLSLLSNPMEKYMDNHQIITKKYKKDEFNRKIRSTIANHNANNHKNKASERTQENYKPKKQTNNETQSPERSSSLNPPQTVDTPSLTGLNLIISPINATDFPSLEPSRRMIGRRRAAILGRRSLVVKASMEGVLRGLVVRRRRRGRGQRGAGDVGAADTEVVIDPPLADPGGGSGGGFDWKKSMERQFIKRFFGENHGNTASELDKKREPTACVSSRREEDRRGVEKKIRIEDEMRLERDKCKPPKLLKNLHKLTQLSQSPTPFKTLHKLPTPNPTHPILPLLRRAAQHHHPINDLRALHAHTITSGLSAGPFGASRLIKFFLQTSPAYARAAFASIDHPDVYTWNAMIAGHSPGPSAVRYYFDMRARAAPPNNYTFALLAKAATGVGDVGGSLVRVVHGQVVKCGGRS